MSPLIGSGTHKLCCCVMTMNHTVDKLTGNKGLSELQIIKDAFLEPHVLF